MLIKIMQCNANKLDETYIEYSDQIIQIFTSKYVSVIGNNIKQKPYKNYCI